MFDTIERTDLASLHARFHRESGLKAFIAIHSTTRGPALGGCRCLHYKDEQSALTDAINLARSMSYKAALAGLDQGGGKAVIMLPEGDFDRNLLYGEFGKFIESLNGCYITAVDSGTSLQDLDIVAQQTSHVVGTGQDGFDPSPLTARGVLAGIVAAVKWRLQRNSLAGLKMAIQGVGHVGSSLAMSLHQCGVDLFISDVDTDRAHSLASLCNATVVDSGAIYAADVDVFIPCALGACLNRETISQLKCSVVAGAANNQLAQPTDGDLLLRKNILYAPDYLINAGGLIRLSLAHAGRIAEVESRVDSIAQTLEKIFHLAQRENSATNRVADRLAQEQL